MSDITKWRVKRDKYTEALAPEFDGSGNHPLAKPPALVALEGLERADVPEDFSIGVVLGPSGSGKTFVLEHLCRKERLWQSPVFPPDMAVCSHEGLQAEGNEHKAVESLDFVGLNDIPSRLKPFQVLSNGERSRVLMALQAFHSGAVLDDFAAVLDDQAARSMASCLARSVRQLGLRGVLVATTKSVCVPFLQPDFVIDMEKGVLHTNPHPQEERRTLVQMDAPDVSFQGSRVLVDSGVPLGWHGPADENSVLVPERKPQDYGAGGRQPKEVAHMTEAYEKTVQVNVDEVATTVANAFEYEFTGQITTKLKRVRSLKAGPFGYFRLGVLSGPSGCGKTTQLQRFGQQKKLRWRKDMSVASQIGESGASPELLTELLETVALPVATALRPFHKLSSSERHRAEIARYILTGGTIDEFTSCLDRVTAQQVCYGVARFVRHRGTPKPLVVAAVHEDVVPALFADWVFYVKAGTVIAFDGGDPTAESIAEHAPLNCTEGRSARQDVASLFKPPTIRLRLRVISRNLLQTLWDTVFKAHHYLDSKLTHTLGSVGLMARNLDGNGEMVALHAIANSPGMPPLSAPLAFREHRLVVLPEWQGFGIGPRISELVGEMILASGFRFFSKTAHPRLGAARMASSLWRPTVMNMVSARKTIFAGASSGKADPRYSKSRCCFSHQFLGKCGHGNAHVEDPTRWLFRTRQDGAAAPGCISGEEVLKYAKFCETCGVLKFHSESHQSRFGTHQMRPLTQDEKTQYLKKTPSERVADLLTKRNPHLRREDFESPLCPEAQRRALVLEDLERPVKRRRLESDPIKSKAAVSRAAAVLLAAATGAEDELKTAQELSEMHLLLEELLPPPDPQEAQASSSSISSLDNDTLEAALQQDADEARTASQQRDASHDSGSHHESSAEDFEEAGLQGRGDLDRRRPGHDESPQPQRRERTSPLVRKGARSWDAPSFEPSGVPL